MARLKSCPFKTRLSPRAANTTVLQNGKSRRISTLHRIRRVNRNGTSRAKDRENIDEDYNVPAKLQLCNTVVLDGIDRFGNRLVNLPKSGFTNEVWSSLVRLTDATFQERVYFGFTSNHQRHPLVNFVRTEREDGQFSIDG